MGVRSGQCLCGAVTVRGDVSNTAQACHCQRAVCGTCGSTLYWKLQGRPIAFVALGLLDDQSGITITEEIFIDSRPDWFPPFAGAIQRTEAEMKAQLAAFLEKETVHDQV